MEQVTIHVSVKCAEFIKANPSFDLSPIIEQYIIISEQLSKTNGDEFRNNICENINRKLQNFEHLLESSYKDIQMKLLTSKNDYISDMKTLFSAKSNEDTKTISEIIVAKTNTLLSEQLPKLISDNEKSANIEHVLKEFTSKISNEASKFVVENSANHYENIIDRFSTNIQSQMTNSISILNNHLSSELTALKLDQQSLKSQVQTFLSSFQHNSTKKGEMSEYRLRQILEEIYSEHGATIEDTSKTASSGDIVLHRQNKEPILFENKCYSRPVANDEVIKFRNDVIQRKMSGIMLSQTTAICNKKHFEIEVVNGLFLLYVHNVNYNHQTIKFAVHAIDALTNAFSLVKRPNEGLTVQVDKKLLSDINADIISFKAQKETLISTVKTSARELETQINALELQAVVSLLHRYGFSNAEMYTCTICNSVFSSNKALTTHKNTCKKKHSKQQQLETQPQLKDIIQLDNI